MTPKTNWTSADYYNADDLNRVENNTDYLRTALIAIGYTVPSITTNVSRIGSSYDNLTSINRVELNLNTIKNSFITPSTWIDGKTWTETTAFTVDDANRWESNQQALYDLSTVIPQSFRYAGTFASNEEVLPQV